MPLLNYTTTVAPDRTAAQIQQILAKGKARSVVLEYDENGRLIGLAFEVNTPFGYRQFVLPVNVEAVLQVLQRQQIKPSYRTRAQAERTAWRILKDWIEAQLAIVATQMVTLDQVMLPYLRTDDGSTVYDRYVCQQLLLEPANGGDGW